MTAHHEIYLESYVVKKLVERGWVEGSNSHYDPVLASTPKMCLAGLKPRSQKLEKNLSGYDRALNWPVAATSP